MSRRYLYAGLGVIALAVALALPAIAQDGWRGGATSGRRLLAQGATVRAATIDSAVERVRQVLAGSGYTDLVPKEVMEFSNHFYVLVIEKSTGKGALELIVERDGFVHPEPGPNMMWNTKYGHMAGFGGMMGGRGMMGQAGPGWGPGMMGPGGPGYGYGYGQGQAPAQTIGRERARQLAAQFLARATPGATPDEGTEFYGYFTFDMERGGKVLGMLSVNAYTGQVWYHTWHGTFVQEKEL